MIVYVWERKSNERMLVIKHVSAVKTLSKSFVIVPDEGDAIYIDRADFKLTIYSY